jgi:hypothetical protein
VLGPLPNKIPSQVAYADNITQRWHLSMLYIQFSGLNRTVAGNILNGPEPVMSFQVNEKPLVNQASLLLIAHPMPFVNYF